MLDLKKYQKFALDELGEYLDEIHFLSNTSVPYNLAFYDKTRTEYKDEFGVPFVCIKIPTGGGKTLVACHMIPLIYEKYLMNKQDKGLVLWLVPTDIIRTQTLNALKDPDHFYRQALDHHFKKNVKIFDIKEAMSIKTTDLDESLCVVVATIGAFRREKKEYLKINQENGKLLEHFQNVDAENLIKDNDQNVVYSLGNVIRLSNPLIVIDEGHHTTTPLSYDVLQELNPSFLLEFTATPREKSNVLVHVTAKDLQLEHMVKIPIYLHNVTQWQQTIREGVAQQNLLEKIAKKEKGEYIRPIVLIQAELEKQDDKKVHIQKIIDFLKTDCNIDDKEIAVKTATVDQISDKNLLSNKSPIRYVLTVTALTEGWDNPFVYILISVANIGAKISVEQTIGRILRLLNAKEKKNPELNYSYVFTSSHNFSEAANSLTKGLVSNGFSKTDIRNFKEKEKFDVTTSMKIIDKKIHVPYIGIKNDKRKIDYFQDLIGGDFDLSKQDIPANFDPYHDQNKMQKIDIEKGDTLKKSVQTKLDIVYDFKDFSTEQLINWLDQKINRKEYSQKEKLIFIAKFVDVILATKKYSLSKLSINCYRLKDKINEFILEKENEQSLKNFSLLEQQRKLDVNSITFSFDDEIQISAVLDDEFQRHLYEKSGLLNKEELDLAQSIDLMENISWWYRNRKKQDFFIQGWRKNRFYPDLIIKTTKGKYLIVEYKGEHLLTNEDTKYKKKLGEKWAILAGKNYEFYLISKKEVAGFLKTLESL